MVKVAKGGKDGALFDLGLMEVLLLERLLVKPLLGHELVGGVLALSLVPTRMVVVLTGLSLALHLGAIGDEVVRVSIVEATILGPRHATNSRGCCETT